MFSNNSLDSDSQVNILLVDGTPALECIAAPAPSRLDTPLRPAHLHRA